MTTANPLHFGNMQYRPESVSTAVSGVQVRPQWLPLTKDNLRLFDVGRLVFDQAKCRQKSMWKLVKKGKRRAKKKTTSVQRPGSMDTLTGRNFTRQRIAVRYFNRLRDLVEKYPKTIMLERKYLYDQNSV